MLKIYIAGKIGNLPEKEYKANFDKAEWEASELGYIPVSPLKLPHAHGRTWSEFMREDLIAMLKCDAVYALNNWRQSPGATIEVETAKSVGINIIYQPSNPF
jgi:hypothetical protein